MLKKLMFVFAIFVCVGQFFILPIFQSFNLFLVPMLCVGTYIPPTLCVVKDAGASYTNVPTQSVGTRMQNIEARRVQNIGARRNCWFGFPHYCWFEFPNSNQALPTSQKPSLKTLLHFALCTLYSPFFQSTAYAAAEKREYTLGAHFENTGGLAAAQQLEITSKIAELLEKKTGIKVVVERFANQKDIFDAFVKGKIDAMGVTETHMIALKEKGIEVLPFSTFTVGKREKFAECLWQKKDKPYTSLSDIIGTTLLGPFDVLEDTIITLERLRDYLYKNGIDKPLWKVFKGFQKVANKNSAFLAIGAGNGDFYFCNDDYDFYLKLMMPSIFEHISHKFCTERIFDRGMTVFNKKTVNAQDYKIIVETEKEILENADEIFKKDKDLRGILQMVKTVKLKPSIITSLNPFEENLKIIEKSKKNGWYEESKFLAEKLFKAEKGQLVIIKFTYEECRAICKSAKNQMVCVDECMK